MEMKKIKINLKEYNEKISENLLKRINIQTILLQLNLIAKVDLDKSDNEVKIIYKIILKIQRRMLNMMMKRGAFETFPMKNKEKL